MQRSDPVFHGAKKREDDDDDVSDDDDRVSDIEDGDTDDDDNATTTANDDDFDEDDNIVGDFCRHSVSRKSMKKKSGCWDRTRNKQVPNNGRKKHIPKQGP